MVAPSNGCNIISNRKVKKCRKTEDSEDHSNYSSDDEMKKRKVKKIKKHKSCLICGEKFRFKIGLKKHVQDEHKSSFKCEPCDRMFISEKNLRRHTRTIHLQKRVYTCDQCGKSSFHLSSFRRHVQIHNGEKKFKCELCFRTFLRKDKLKRHMFVHTGVKNFACELCSNRYSRKDKLNQHIAKYHYGYSDKAASFVESIQYENKETIIQDETRETIIQD